MTSPRPIIAWFREERSATAEQPADPVKSLALIGSAGLFRLPWPDMFPVRLAEFAAVAFPVLLGKSFSLGERSEALLDPAVLPDNHVAAARQAERLRQLSKMIELRTGRMLERLEPRRIDEVRHFESVHEERVFLNRIAHFVAVLRVAGLLRPQIGDRIDHHLEQLVRSRYADRNIVVERGPDEYLRDRQPPMRDVVITLSLRFIGVVEIDEQPIGPFPRPVGVVQLDRI